MRRLLLLVPIPALLVAATAAWACTPQPRSFAVSPSMAVAGSAASVVGQGVAPGEPVEVRWNRLDGGVIGTAVADERGRFRADVRIPEAAPGVYSVLFAAGGQPSKATGVGRLAFEVAGSNGQRASSERPEFWSSQPETHRSNPNGNSLALGAGLASLGAVTLSAGATLAVLRRTRRNAG